MRSTDGTSESRVREDFGIPLIGVRPTGLGADARAVALARGDRRRQRVCREDQRGGGRVSLGHRRPDPVGSRGRALGSACGRRPAGAPAWWRVRRDVPGLSAQLRRRERRRGGRPRRAARPAALPRRPRRRRPLDLARGSPRRWPTAATTSATSATSTRCSARSRTPTRCSREAHALGPAGASSTSSPTTPPTSTRGSSRPWPPARVARAGALLLPRRAGRRTARAAEQLDQRVRRSGLDPGHRARRHARPVVPAPVRPRAAGPRLEQPGGARRLRRRAAVLVRPRGRRPADRRRARPCPRRPGLPDADYGGVLQFRTVDWDDNPHWDVDDGARHLPALAGHRRHLRRGPRVRRRGGRQHARAAGRYLRPDEMHTAFNFPYLKGPWEAERAARRSSTPRWPRSRRSGVPVDLGADQPRRDPPGHALRPPDDELVLHHRRRGRGRPTWRWAPGGPGPRRCSCLPFPAAPTSTRARSSGCPTSTTCPTRCCRTRCSCAAVAQMRGRDGCRVPLPWSGHGAAVRVLARRASSRGCRSRVLARPHRRGRRSSDPASMLSLYRQALRLRRELPRAARRQGWPGATRPEGVLDFDRGEALRCVVNLSDDPVAVPDDRVLLSSIPLEDGLLPTDATAWLRLGQMGSFRWVRADGSGRPWSAGAGGWR